MKRLNEIEARANAATEGPWETDGTGEVSQHWSRPKPWESVVGAEVSCMSYCYGGSAKGVERTEDAEFIAHSRTDVPDMAAALRAVLKLHKPGRTFHGHGFSQPLCKCGAPLPCPTVETIRQHLGEDD